MSIPTGWVSTELGKIVEFKYGRGLPEKSRVAGPFQVYGSNGPVGTHQASLTQAPTIIVGRKGSIGEVHYSPQGCFPIDTTYFIDQFDACEPFFAFHLLRSLPLDQLNRATAIPGLNRDDAYRLNVLLPPLSEQRRIVAKIDSLSAKSRRARDHLDHIPRLVEKYKQAILAAAFPVPETEGNIVALGEIAEIQSGSGFPKTFQGKTSGDFPFAKVSDISRCVAAQRGLLTGAANYVTRQDLAVLRAKPVPAGATVFAKIGEALRLNRRAMTAIPAVLDNNCMALIPDHERVDPRYLFWFMHTVDLSPFAVATAVPSVRRSDVAGLRLPLLGLPEQQQAVRLIESAVSWIERLASETSSARKLIEHLDQAVLAKAFRGELVPQDPNDEPASVLLERIKHANGMGEANVKGRGARGKSRSRTAPSSA